MPRDADSASGGHKPEPKPLSRLQGLRLAERALNAQQMKLFGPLSCVKDHDPVINFAALTGGTILHPIVDALNEVAHIPTDDLVAEIIHNASLTPDDIRTIASEGAAAKGMISGYEASRRIAEILRRTGSEDGPIPN